MYPRKYGAYLRVAGCGTDSKLSMQSLIHRAIRQMNSDSIIPQSGWVDTPHNLDDDTAWKQQRRSSPTKQEDDNTIAIRTWRESLIEFVQLGQCNMQVKTTRHYDTDLQQITAHPILDYLDPADDEISREDLVNCLLQ